MFTRLLMDQENSFKLISQISRSSGSIRAALECNSTTETPLMRALLATLSAKPLTSPSPNKSFYVSPVWRKRSSFHLRNPFISHDVLLSHCILRPGRPHASQRIHQPINPQTLQPHRNAAYAHLQFSSQKVTHWPVPVLYLYYVSCITTPWRSRKPHLWRHLPLPFVAHLSPTDGS